MWLMDVNKLDGKHDTYRNRISSSPRKIIWIQKGPFLKKISNVAFCWIDYTKARDVNCAVLYNR